MRAWAAIGAFLVLASTAAAEQPGDSEVPPLADGESAPADVPNYFNTQELGAATLAALAACHEAIVSANLDLDETTQAAYCGCFADTARWNVSAGRAIAATDPQMARCVEVAQTQASSPFSHQFAIPTASIVNTFNACMEVQADGLSISYRGFVCSCATNAWITDRLRANKLDEDLARCAVAGRYREDTGQNPTRRQFAAIRVTPPRVRSGSGDPVSQPLPGAFIPYPGNGGGPTLCSDGMYSHSSGRGTCSHHGGVSGGRHRRR